MATPMVRSWFASILVLGLIAVGIGCSGGATSTQSSSSSSPSDDPIVATYAGDTLTLSEFNAAYRSANQQQPSIPDSSAGYQDFLEQYVNYRLKVNAARDAGLDTLSSVQREIDSYRHEMARPRLMRREVYEPLARTLYERRAEEVDVSHILKRVGENAAPADTAAAYREMQSIVDSLRRGDASFAELAYRNSEDPSAQKSGEQGYEGRLGYIRAGQIVGPFEDRMYKVPPDSVSDIFRTQFGYHVLKVHDRRPARQPIRLAHIMRRPDDNPEAARRLLDSLRTELVENDADFATLAETYSEDPRSASEGGDLGRVERRQALPPSFRRAVADLDSVGAVSPVVESQYGLHLIKLTDREDRPSFEAAYEDLKSQIESRSRVDRRKARFAQQVRADVGVSVDTARIRSAVGAASLDTLSRSLLSSSPRSSSGSAAPAIATLGDSTYTLDQLRRHVMQMDGGAQSSLGEVLADFLDEKAFWYAEAQLADRDSSFAATMKQYRDGLLAFQFMQDSVWTVAAQDTAGLRETFRANRDQYRLPERVRTIALRAPSDSLLRLARGADSTVTDLSAVVRRAHTDSLVSVDTTLVTDETPPPYQEVLSIADRATVGPLSHDADSLLLIRDTRLPPRQKTFEEARSEVIRDYQDQYEDRVLARLRRRYDAETYPERLTAAAPADTSTAPPSSRP